MCVRLSLTYPSDITRFQCLSRHEWVCGRNSYLTGKQIVLRQLSTLKKRALRNILVLAVTFSGTCIIKYLLKMLPSTQSFNAGEIFVSANEKCKHQSCPTRSKSLLGILNSAFNEQNRVRHHLHNWQKEPLRDDGHESEEDYTFVDKIAKDKQVQIENMCQHFGRFEVSRSSCENARYLENKKADDQASYLAHTELHFMEEDCLGRPVAKPHSTLILFNISGTRFVVRHATLQRDPYVFAKILEDAVWIPSTKEYYFERDAVLFRFIHNYLRSGEVHLPLGMCGPLLEKELDEWGIPLGLDIQRCCLGPVIDSKSKLESLKKFERKLDPQPRNPVCWIKCYRWQAFRSIIWHILEAPSHLSHRKTLSLLSVTNKENSHRKSSDFSVDNFSQTLTSQSTGDVAQITVTTNTDGGLSQKPHREPLSETATTSFVWSYMAPTPHMIRWLRKCYLVYEIMIIALAVLVFMLSTVPEMQSTVDRNENRTKSKNTSVHHPLYRIPSEWLVYSDFFFSTAISLDVIARMVFCPDLRAWITSPSTLIDLISLIPFYNEIVFYSITNFGVLDVSHEGVYVVIQIRRYIAILKVFIVLRLFRVLKRHRSTRVLLYTIRTTFADVAIIVVLIVVSALFFGTLIYFTDDNFRDIPSGSWWALITMSTVGYGDLVPKHTYGYIVAMICIIIGTLLMSYNIPILVNHFLLYYDHADQLCHVKQLHRNAKRKARRLRVSVGTELALNALKSYLWTTGTDISTFKNAALTKMSNPNFSDDM